MCDEVKKLRLLLEKESREENTFASDYKWSPMISVPCKLNCEESLTIFCEFVNFFVAGIRPAIDPKTIQAIEEDKFPEQARQFSELNTIIDSDEISDFGKSDLIRVPSEKAVTRFLQTVFSSWKLSREIVILARILLDRFLAKTKWSLRATTWRTLILITLNIASKHEGRPFVSNIDLAIAYPIHTADEFCQLELLFLELIDYRCYVKLTEYKEYLDKMIPE